LERWGHTELHSPRRRRGHSSGHTSKEIVDAVRVLAHTCTDDIIAGVLNRNGLVTGRGNRWTQELVTSLRSKHQIPCSKAGSAESHQWMNLTNAARFIGISPITLRLAIEAGEIEAYHPLSDGPWIFSRTTLESAAAKTLVSRVQRNLRCRKTNP